MTPGRTNMEKNSEIVAAKLTGGAVAHLELRTEDNKILSLCETKVRIFWHAGHWFITGTSNFVMGTGKTFYLDVVLCSKKRRYRVGECKAKTGDVLRYPFTFGFDFEAP